MKSRKLNQDNQQLNAGYVVEKLELPKDLFLGMPLLSLEGNRELCITNHRGIISCSRETIVIAAREYGIEIAGRNLSIPRFSKEVVEITGFLESITFRL